MAHIGLNYFGIGTASQSLYQHIATNGAAKIEVVSLNTPPYSSASLKAALEMEEGGPVPAEGQ